MRKKDFSAIPYDDDVTLSVPLARGGAGRPLSGKEALRTQWWQPLEPALENVRITVLDHYMNDSMTGIVAEIKLAQSTHPSLCVLPTASR